MMHDIMKFSGCVVFELYVNIVIVAVMICGNTFRCCAFRKFESVTFFDIKSSLYYGITPKRVTGGGVHLRCLHCCEETSQRWRALTTVSSGAGTFFRQGGLKIVRSCQRLGGEAPQTPLFSNARF